MFQWRSGHRVGSLKCKVTSLHIYNIHTHTHTHHTHTHTHTHTCTHTHTHTNPHTHTHTHTHTHIRFVSLMPSPATFMAFSFLLRMVEGIGTAMYATASYTQLTTFYPEKKATIVVSCTLNYYETFLHLLHFQGFFLYTYDGGTQAGIC